MKKTTALLAILAASGCFNPEDPPASSDTDDPTSAATTGPTSGAPTTDPTSGGTMSTTVDPSDSETATTTVGPDPDTGESSSSTGEPQLGPRLVESTPADGDMNAPLQPFFLLQFDRPISQNDALGNIFVTQDGGDPILVAPQPCPPDADPQCVAGLFPEEFSSPEGDLPGNTEHTIIVSADLPDLDGNTNTLEQVVEFRTFEFTANFFDDSAAISGELGGMVYDPANDALFVAGTTSTQDDCIVRRIDIEGGVASPAITVATPAAQGGGPYCYGMQRYGDTLYVDMSYSGDVRSYTGLTNDDLNPFEVIIENPTLASPHDDLDEVIATASVGPRLFFSFGSFFGGPQAYAIVEFTNGNWSLFQEGTNLWMQDDEVSIATGDVGPMTFMFAHTGEHLYKFRVSDGTVVADVEVPNQFTPDVEVDAFGRVWVASNGLLTVYSGEDLSQIAIREGLDTGRIGVDPEPNSATVYFARYRDPAVIGRMVVELP